MGNNRLEQDPANSFQYKIINGWQGFCKEYSVIYKNLDIDALPKWIQGFNLVCTFGKRVYGVNNGKAYLSHFNQYYVHNSVLPISNLNIISLFFQTESPGVHTRLFGLGIDSYSDYVDIASGVFRPEQIVTKFNNYLALPFYILTLVRDISFPILDELKAYLSSLNQRRQQLTDNRSLYCCLVCSHDTLDRFTGVRATILNSLNQVLAKKEQQVICGGRFHNNSDMLKVECQDNKIEFAKKFIFNICPENSYASGYVTEKIFDAIVAGCIPIYWGCLEHEQGIFNKRAIVEFDPHKVDSFKAQMSELVNNEEQLANLMAEPPFLEGAAETIFTRYFAPIYQKVTALGLEFNHLRKNSKVDSSYAWQDDYIRAKQTLAELNVNPVDFQDHLFNQSFYQWPFLKTDRIRVACDYRPVLQQYSQETLGLVASKLTPKTKPLYDDLSQELAAVQSFRVTRLLQAVQKQQLIAKHKHESIFNAKAFQQAQDSDPISQRPLSALAVNVAYAKDFTSELEQVASQEMVSTEIASKNISSENISSKEIVNKEDNTDATKEETVATALDLKTVKQTLLANLSATNTHSHNHNSHEQAFISQPTGSLTKLTLEPEFISHISNIYQQNTLNLEQQVSDLISHIERADKTYYKNHSKTKVKSKFVPCYLAKPHKKLSFSYKAFKFKKKLLLNLGLYSLFQSKTTNSEMEFDCKGYGNQEKGQLGAVTEMLQTSVNQQDFLEKVNGWNYNILLQELNLKS